MDKIRNFGKILVMLVTWLLWRIRKTFTPITDQEPQCICVLYLSGMGDILCDTFFFQQLRQKYPDARLTGCFPAHFCELQREFFAFDAYIAHRSYRQTLQELWHLNADLIIIPGWLTKNSLLAILSNAQAILGYINDLSFTNRYLNSFTLEFAGWRGQTVVQDMRKCHLAERPGSITTALGLTPLKIEDLILPRLRAANTYMVVHAGASFEGRRWKEESFAAVIDWCINQQIADQVYLVGDRYDRVINLRIKAFSGGNMIVDKAGALSLKESFELIAGACLFVGNDSGPMHIASLAGVPTLALMGPNFPNISGPLGNSSRYIFHQFPCSGCNQRGCNYAYRCIASITVDEVIQTIKEMQVKYD